MGSLPTSQFFYPADQPHTPELHVEVFLIFEVWHHRASHLIWITIIDANEIFYSFRHKINSEIALQILHMSLLVVFLTYKLTQKKNFKRIFFIIKVQSLRNDLEFGASQPHRDPKWNHVFN